MVCKPSSFHSRLSFAFFTTSAKRADSSAMYALNWSFVTGNGS